MSASSPTPRRQDAAARVKNIPRADQLEGLLPLVTPNSAESSLNTARIRRTSSNFWSRALSARRFSMTAPNAMSHGIAIQAHLRVDVPACRRFVRPCKPPSRWDEGMQRAARSVTY